ncbi:MAG: hypothetical protein KDA67_13385 [Rhodobacteraceae bacterium]|nr:hypothetical protein [Paracoccaceae bacterium]
MAEDAKPNPHQGKMAPAWLAEMRKSRINGHHVSRPNGFYVNYQKFAAVHVARGDDILVVTFDNLSAVNDESLEREAWGDKFFAENSWSSLGIISFDANWYRDDTLFDYLEGLRDQGFFAAYKRVVFTGTSMGGYAACAFCGLAPGATVISYSPQSTLKKDLVPWEKRFNRGRQQDWSGRYADSAALTASAEKVYLCYDPYEQGDKTHAQRYSGDNIVHLHSNYVGHKTVVFLRRAGILKSVTGMCISGDMTEAIFNDLYRSRRKLPWYYMGLIDMAMERGHLGLAERIIKTASSASGNPNLSSSLQKRRDLFLDKNKKSKK